MGEVWGFQPEWSIGDSYDLYVGHWSRLVARVFLDWLAIPSNSAWLDVGCGTGALVQTIVQYTSPDSVKGIDRSPDFVNYVRAHTTNPGASFEVGDAQNLPVEADTYDAVVSGLVLNFIPDATSVISEMKRVAKRGGMVAVYVWDYADKMELMHYFWNAAVALNPAAKDLDEGRLFPLCKPEPLAELFRAAGLENVETRSIDIPTRFENFDEYWTPFLGGQGPAPGYAISLNQTERTTLREKLRSTLPIAPDGSIALIARAWAVRGKAD